MQHLAAMSVAGVDAVPPERLQVYHCRTQAQFQPTNSQVWVGSGSCPSMQPQAQRRCYRRK
jgi:hypothetical protein